MMRRLIPSLFALFVLLSACKRKDIRGSETFEFQMNNLVGKSIGLEPGDIALTFDDGPDLRTLELAEWLAAHDFPATFFLVGQKVLERQTAVEKLSKMQLKSGGFAFLIGNHSYSHAYLPSANATREIKSTDEILKKYVDTNRQPYLFRPPFGAFIEGGDRFVNRVNHSGDLAKYIGPIYWDIGGSMENGFAADFVCWLVTSFDNCINGYIAETLERNGGIMRLHDNYSATVDMLTGTNVSGRNPGKRSLLLELANYPNRKFKFVGLDKNKTALARFGTVTENNFGNVIFSSAELGGGEVAFDIHVPEADKVEVWVDRYDRPIAGGRLGDDKKLKKNARFSQLGSRVVTVKGFASGGLVARQSYTIEVKGAASSARPEPTAVSTTPPVSTEVVATGDDLTSTTTNQSCPAFKKLLDNRTLKIRQGNTPPLNGHLRTQDVKILDSGDYEFMFSLTYPNVPSDYSEVRMVISPLTGVVKSAVRQNWSKEKSITFRFEWEDVNCERGEWKGSMISSDGKTDLWSMLTQ